MTCVHSHEAVRLMGVLAVDSWKLGTRYSVHMNGEEMEVQLTTNRTYIYGTERTATIVKSRQSIEGLKNMTEQDVLAVMRTAIDAQELM